MNFSISYNLGSFLFVIIRSPNGEYIRAHERHTAVALLIPMAALHKPDPERGTERRDSATITIHNHHIIAVGVSC